MSPTRTVTIGLQLDGLVEDLRRSADALNAAADRLDPPGPATTGVGMIAAERARHRGRGWTADHDAEHVNGELIAAAVAYAQHADPDGAGESAADCWPWDPESWKPSTPVRDLVKAGALIAAELDRRVALSAEEAHRG